MALKTYRPTSPGRRGMSGYTFDEITKDRPEKSLITSLRKQARRNFRGVITVRHRGGGEKRMLRTLTQQGFDDSRGDRFEYVLIFTAVAARPIGDADHADRFACAQERHSQKGLDRRVPTGNADAVGVQRWRIGKNGFPALKSPAIKPP